MSPSIGRCSSTSKDMVSRSLLTFCLWSLICLSYGDDIYGISTLCLPTCINVGIINGATLLFIIFWTLAYVFSCFFLTLDPEAPPSSILFFLFITLLGDSTTMFFLLFNVACMSFLVLLTLVCGFYGLFFVEFFLKKIFAKIRADWHVSFLSPLVSLTCLYHWSNLLHKLLYIICTQSNSSLSLLSLVWWHSYY